MHNTGETPVYSSDSTNNGIIGYTNRIPEFVIDKDNQIYVVFGDHTRSFNIATNDFCVADNVKVLKVESSISLKSLLFINASWRKCINDKGYSRHWSVAQKVTFELPVRNNQPDYALMESFIAELEAERIAELEAERIAELEAYLKASELKDYTLTPEEEKVLSEYERKSFATFNIIDIFNVKNSGNILARDIVENSGKTPYLCASAENNAVSSYISYDRKYLDKGNCVFIGGKTFVVSYQENDFFSNDSHNLILDLKHKSAKTKLNQLYLSACVTKSLKYKYSWGDSISNKKIQKDKISLPTNNNQPDYSSMSTLISAIQKLVIKDVVLYADKKIAATKQITHSN